MGTKKTKKKKLALDLSKMADNLEELQEEFDNSNIEDEEYLTDLDNIISGSKKIQKINVNDIEIEEQVRKILNEEELKNLADSIKKLGLIQPIVVAEKNNGKYKLIAGYRRLSAVKNILKQSTIYAVVVPFIDIQDKEKLTAMQLAENLKRQDLTTFEYALAVGEYTYNYFTSALRFADKSSFIKYLSDISIFQKKKEEIQDEKIKDAFISICSDLDISWATLIASLWLWSFSEQFYDILLTTKNLTFTHCNYTLRHGISFENFVTKYLPKIEEGLSTRELARLLQREQKSTKKKKPTEEEKVYSKLSTLLGALKRSKVIKYNEKFRKEIADSLRRMADELEKLQ